MASSASSTGIADEETRQGFLQFRSVLLLSRRSETSNGTVMTLTRLATVRRSEIYLRRCQQPPAVLFPANRQ